MCVYAVILKIKTMEMNVIKPKVQHYMSIWDVVWDTALNMMEIRTPLRCIYASWATLNT